MDTDVALDMYQNAYNVYSDLELMLDSVATDIHWARVRFTVRRIYRYCFG